MAWIPGKSTSLRRYRSTRPLTPMAGSPACSAISTATDSLPKSLRCASNTRRARSYSSTMWATRCRTCTDIPERLERQRFVAVLGFSYHTYGEVSLGQAHRDSLRADVRGLNHFLRGGPRAIVPAY
jgi:hypothetical protein